jgi:hypothetical protein
MQYTPPHSPDQLDEGAHHRHHFHYPTELNLDLDSNHDFKPTLIPNHDFVIQEAGEPLFAKRPISPPLSSGELSDCTNTHPHSHSHSHSHDHPVSLLSALMHSPKSNPASTPATTAHGFLSPHSSVPSTAVSSPHLRPTTSNSHHTGHGGLDVPAMSILRRDSVSSDGEALNVPQAGGVEMKADVSRFSCHHRVSFSNTDTDDR